MDKLLETLLPNLFKDRTVLMLKLVFLLLFLEDYLLLAGRDFTWLKQTLPRVSIQEASCFFIVLVFCSRLVLPILHTACCLIWISIRHAFPFEAKTTTYSSHYLTSSQLLSQALVKQNTVAYQCFKKHEKEVKERQAVRELCFYIFAVVCLNICLPASLTKYLFFLSVERFPVGIFVVLPSIIILLVQGVGNFISNEDEWTSVQVSKQEIS